MDIKEIQTIHPSLRGYTLGHFFQLFPYSDSFENPLLGTFAPLDFLLESYVKQFHQNQVKDFFGMAWVFSC